MSTSSPREKLICGGLAASLLLLAGGLHWSFTSSEWASWVQAVGSILAIAAALVVVTEQARTARLQVEADDLHAEYRRFNMAQTIAGQVRWAIKQNQDYINKAPEDEKTAKAVVDLLTNTSAVLQAAPYFEFKNAEAARTLHILVTAVESFAVVAQCDPQRIPEMAAKVDGLARALIDFVAHEAKRGAFQDLPNVYRKR